MGARDILCDLRAAGLSVAVDGDRLVIRPASLLTDAMRAELRQAKPELLALLSAPTAPPRSAVFPPLHDPVPDGGRDVLGWLDSLGPLTADELAAAMQWPRGAAVGLALRLRDLGLIRQSGERWRLAPHAESVALVPATDRPEPVNARRPPRANLTEQGRVDVSRAHVSRPPTNQPRNDER